MMSATTLHTLCGGIVVLWLLGACAASPARPPIAFVTAEPLSTVAVETVPTTIDLAQRTPYQHSSGLFTLDAPASWRVEDDSRADELSVRFREPNENAAIATTVLTISQQLDSSALTQLLQAHLRNAYGAQTAFRQQPANPQNDGSMQILWHCTTTVDGAATQLFGSSQIAQHGDHVALLSVVVPETQFASLAPEIAAITDSYTISATANAPAQPLVPVEIGELQPYTYDNGLFQLDIPAGWVEQNKSTPGKAFVAWNDPASTSWLAVQVLQDDSQRSRSELGNLLLAVATAAFSETVTLDEPAAQEDGSVLLEWNYTTPASNGVAARIEGRSFARQDGDKVVVLAFATPANQNDQLHNQFDLIRDAFVIEPTAPMP